MGRITESDVMMASSANALILGFDVQISPNAKRMAGEEGVEVKVYKVIYELIDDVLNRLNQMIEPETKREKAGKLKVKALFFTEKGKMIVGGDVISGSIIKDSPVKVYRGEKEIGEGVLKNLQTGKVDVDKVGQGKEAGITYEGPVKIKEDDEIEVWKEEKIKKSISLKK